MCGPCTQGLAQLQLAGAGQGILKSVNLVAPLQVCTSLPVVSQGS